MIRLRLVTTACALALLVAACGGSGKAAGSGATKTASAVLQIGAGACDAGKPTGSWFRMVQPGGTTAAGPYVDNGDSPCPDKTVTPLRPGTDGGLRVGTYQPQPDPPFAKSGASRSGAVIEPVAFFAVPFGISTNPTDPQTNKKVPRPTVTIDGTRLTADLSALSVSWNGQQFNQGAPKPGGGGQASGTYDKATGRYTLDWTSAIKGGPFDGFIGVWHLEGIYRTEGT